VCRDGLHFPVYHAGSRNGTGFPVLSGSEWLAIGTKLLRWCGSGLEARGASSFVLL
jgi:hypothetical protein